MSPYKYYRRMFFVYEKYGTGKAQYWKPCFKKKVIIITYNNLTSKEHFERFIKREFSNWRYGEFLFKNRVGEIYGRITIRDNANIVEVHKLGTNGRIYPLYKKLFMKLTTRDGLLDKLERDIKRVRKTGKLSTSNGPYTKKDQSPG